MYTNIRRLAMQQKQLIQIEYRGVAQVVERYFREVEAASSSLVTPMITGVHNRVGYGHLIFI